MSELAYLPTFLAVCEEGGFLRASERLNLSQPAVSYQIRTLETRLGVKLFERAGRGVVLTERGAMLRDYCRSTLTDFETLKQELRVSDVVPNRTLKIASVSAFGRYVLFPILRKHFAAARVELRFPTQEDVLRLVSSGFADLGFTFQERVSSDIISEKVTTEELVLIAAGPHARKTPVSFAQVRAMPFVTWDEYEFLFGQWFGSVYGRQPGPLRSVAHFEEMEEVIAWVQTGAGVSVVPRDCAAAAISKKAVTVLWPTSGRRCINEIFAVYRPDRSRPDGAQLVARLRERRARATPASL